MDDLDLVRFVSDQISSDTFVDFKSVNLRKDSRHPIRKHANIRANINRDAPLFADRSNVPQLGLN